MYDVTVKPDQYGKASAIVTKFYFYHDPERKKAAREVLRRVGPTTAYLHEDGMADVALEEIWNALLANE